MTRPSLLEIPPADTIRFDYLAQAAVRQARDIKDEAVAEGRDQVRGVLLTSMRGNSEAGFSLQGSHEEGYELSVHLPDVAAMVPPGSSIDLYLRYGQHYQDRARGVVVSEVWRRHFPTTGAAWPSRSYLFSLAPDENGGLAIGQLSIQPTMLRPAVIISGRTKQLLADGGTDVPPALHDHLELAHTLAAQRMQAGAYETYHDGRMWWHAPYASEMLPAALDEFIKKELLAASSMALAQTLQQSETPGLFVGYRGGDLLPPRGVELLLDRYFKNGLSAHIVDAALGEARGEQYVAGHPIPNCNAYGGPSALIGGRGGRYGFMVNQRQAAAMAAGEPPVYSLEEIEQFADTLNHDEFSLKPDIAAMAQAVLASIHKTLNRPGPSAPKPPQPA